MRSPRRARHTSDRLVQLPTDEHLSNLEGMVMSGESLEFGDGTFDVSTSQNGVSSFPDLQAGLSEIVRVTRPGCLVMIVTFGRLDKAEFLKFFLSAVRACVPGFRPLPLDPPPFRLSDPATFAGALADVGLRDVRVDTVTWATTAARAAGT
jgi:SAM-dependent methyltransferase